MPRVKVLKIVCAASLDCQGCAAGALAVDVEIYFATGKVYTILGRGGPYALSPVHSTLRRANTQNTTQFRCCAQLRDIVAELKDCKYEMPQNWG